MVSMDVRTMTCSLNVAIAGLKNSQGQVRFSLFNSAQGFPGGGEQAIAKGSTSAADATPTFTFENLQPGQYAVAVFHDVNGDGVLNRGLMGIPREGFGFSQNPKLLMGAPSFKRAAITVDNGCLEICIQLKYF